MLGFDWSSIYLLRIFWWTFSQNLNSDEIYSFNRPIEFFSNFGWDSRRKLVNLALTTELRHYTSRDVENDDSLNTRNNVVTVSEIFINVSVIVLFLCCLTLDSLRCCLQEIFCPVTSDHHSSRNVEWFLSLCSLLKVVDVRSVMCPKDRGNFVLKPKSYRGRSSVGSYLRDNSFILQSAFPRKKIIPSMTGDRQLRDSFIMSIVQRRPLLASNHFFSIRTQDFFRTDFTSFLVPRRFDSDFLCILTFDDPLWESCSCLDPSLSASDSPDVLRSSKVCQYSQLLFFYDDLRIRNIIRTPSYPYHHELCRVNGILYRPFGRLINLILYRGIFEIIELEVMSVHLPSCRASIRLSELCASSLLLLNFESQKTRWSTKIMSNF